LTTGVGFTVKVNVIVFPVHPFAEGVIVMVAVTGLEPELVAVKEGILPVPEDPNPILLVLLAQE